MNFIVEAIQSTGLDHPATYALLFLAASMLMIWRLNAMLEHGLEGTALGTLVMPYCSGLGNLIFVFLLLNSHGDPREIMTNCLVNNTTNLTLVLAVPALIWGLQLTTAQAPTTEGKPKRSKKNVKAEKLQAEQHLTRLSLLLTMIAVGVFSGAVWALGQDGVIDFNDGLVLVGLFLFWQCFQVFDVLKHNVRQQKRFSPLFYLDLVTLIVGAVLLYASLDWLVQWLATQKTGFISAKNLGWLSGWLMVLPNALLALYYAYYKRADIVYSSQIGDGHICIPLCVGLFALCRPIPMPSFFATGMITLLAATGLHFLVVVGLGRLPRWSGWLLLAGYGWFVFDGMGGMS
ncbi:MAG: sodium:calcium symporter [Nibricoccus sp.]